MTASRCRGATLAAAVLGALVVATGAGAGTWTWGFNYLGNSTDNGACPSWLPHPGSVCGWNYWASGVIDKRAGGTVRWGWANNNQFAYWTASGSYLWDRTPGDAGMSGYLALAGVYYSDAASYLQLYATT